MSYSMVTAGLPESCNRSPSKAEIVPQGACDGLRQHIGRANKGLLKFDAQAGVHQQVEIDEKEKKYYDPFPEARGYCPTCNVSLDHCMNTKILAMCQPLTSFPFNT